jgi:hypothetical protein
MSRFFLETGKEGDISSSKARKMMRNEGGRSRWMHRLGKQAKNKDCFTQLVRSPSVASLLQPCFNLQQKLAPWALAVCLLEYHQRILL